MWTFDFLLFKKGTKEPIGESSHSRFYARSVNLEIDLNEGEYVVHVRLSPPNRCLLTTLVRVTGSFGPDHVRRRGKVIE